MRQVLPSPARWRAPRTPRHLERPAGGDDHRRTPGRPGGRGHPVVVRAARRRRRQRPRGPRRHLVRRRAAPGGLHARPLDADGNHRVHGDAALRRHAVAIEVEVRDWRGSIGAAAVDLEVVPAAGGLRLAHRADVAPATRPGSNQGTRSRSRARSATRRTRRRRSRCAGPATSTGSSPSRARTRAAPRCSCWSQLSPGPARDHAAGHRHRRELHDRRDHPHGERRPVGAFVSITPSSPSSSQDLQAVIDAASVDPEGDPVSYTYEWLGTASPQPISASLVLGSATARGETWTVRVTPHDDDAAGAYGEASVVVQNAPPGGADRERARPTPPTPTTCSRSVATADRRRRGRGHGPLRLAGRRRLDRRGRDHARRVHRVRQGRPRAGPRHRERRERGRRHGRLERGHHREQRADRADRRRRAHRADRARGRPRVRRDRARRPTPTATR